LKTEILYDKIRLMDTSKKPNENNSAVSKNRIYKDVRRSIIMGHRLPGSRLIVKDIAERYETSVTPVRDALQMLSQDQVIMLQL